MKRLKEYNLIGISGKIGSGKDTVGEIIQQLSNKKENNCYEIKKFADKLKEIVCLLIGCTKEQLEDREFKEKELNKDWWVWKLEKEGGYGTILLPYSTPKKTLSYYEGLKLIKFTPRLLMQTIGTECGREIISPNIWVNGLFSNYSSSCKWIITDVRFHNEIKAIKDKGGIIVKVNRETKRGNHISDTALENYNFDITIENNGSIEDLIKKIEELW